MTTMKKNQKTTYAIARSWAAAKCASTRGNISCSVNVAHDADAFIDLETDNLPVLSIMIHAADGNGSRAVCADYGTGKLMMDVASCDAGEIHYALDRVTAPWFAGDDAPLAA